MSACARADEGEVQPAAVDQRRREAVAVAPGARDSPIFAHLPDDRAQRAAAAALPVDLRPQPALPPAAEAVRPRVRAPVQRVGGRGGDPTHGAAPTRVGGVERRLRRLLRHPLPVALPHPDRLPAVPLLPRPNGRHQPLLLAARLGVVDVVRHLVPPTDGAAVVVRERLQRLYPWY